MDIRSVFSAVIAVAEIEQRFWAPGSAKWSEFMEFGRSRADFHWDPGSSEDLRYIRFMRHSAHYHELHIAWLCFIVLTQQKCGELALGCIVFSDYVLELSQVHVFKLSPTAVMWCIKDVMLIWIFSSIGGCPDRIIACQVLACGGSCDQLEAIYVNILNVGKYQTIAIIADPQLFTATWEIQGCRLIERYVYHNSVRLTAQIQGNDVLIPWDSGNTNALEVVLQRLLLVLHCNLGYALLYPSQEMSAHWCFLLSEAMQCRGIVILTWLISSMGEIYDAAQEYEWLEWYSLMTVHCGDSWLTIIPDEWSLEGFRAISWNSGLSCVHFSQAAISDSASQLLSNARESSGCKFYSDPKVWFLHHFEASLRCQWFSLLTEHVKEQLEPKVAPENYCYSGLGLSAVAGQPYVYCPDAAMFKGTMDSGGFHSFMELSEVAESSYVTWSNTDVNESIRVFPGVLSVSQLVAGELDQLGYLTEHKCVAEELIQIECWTAQETNLNSSAENIFDKWQFFYLWNRSHILCKLSLPCITGHHIQYFVQKSDRPYSCRCQILCSTNSLLILRFTVVTSRGQTRGVLPSTLS
jgi:hypothetical protein